MNALVPIQPSNKELYRASTDAAGLCREIVLKTAQQIGGRKYVRVEGWQAIAIAHGCVASAEDVRRVDEGYSAIGVVRRMADGTEIARAEGFVGDDESTWKSRPVYARRAMAQTRAISRVCRSAFAHVVVLIDANLSTTPAEEMPQDGEDRQPQGEPRNVTPKAQAKAEPKKGTTPKDEGGNAGSRKSTEAVIGAKSAILDTPRDGLEAWLDTNKAALGKLSKDEREEVMEFYREQTKPYVKAAELVEGAAELSPFLSAALASITELATVQAIEDWCKTNDAALQSCSEEDYRAALSACRIQAEKVAPRRERSPFAQEG